MKTNGELSSEDQQYLFEVKKVCDRVNSKMIRDEIFRPQGLMLLNYMIIPTFDLPEAAAASVDNEVRTGGYVWQVGAVSMAPGSPVFPSDTLGQVIKTGGSSFPGGFGTVVYATDSNAAGYILTKLQGLV